MVLARKRKLYRIVVTTVFRFVVVENLLQIPRHFYVRGF